jgi:hypothetical protein
LTKHVPLARDYLTHRRAKMTNEKIAIIILKAISAIEKKLDDPALDKIEKELRAIEEAAEKLSTA